jgi:hypothetical protein
VMPTNDPEYQRVYHAKHYAANKAKYMANAKARKIAFRDKINELKRQPCMDCKGTFNPWQMDYDHRDPSEKEGIIAQLAGSNQQTRTYAEIAKCDLVCANCHRNRTHDRRAGVTQLVE